MIGTNKKDATETVELLLDDARAGKLARAATDGDLDALLDEKGAAYVEYAGWQAIDAAERAAGEPLRPAAREADGLGARSSRPRRLALASAA